MKITLNQPPYNLTKSAYKLADEKIDRWVGKSKYEPALELLQSLKTTTPHRNADNYDYRIWIFNELNQYDNKMNELLDAARHKVFFPLDDESYFEGIEQFSEFDKLRQENRLALEALRQNAKPELDIYLPEGEGNGELLLILHGNRQYIESITEQWPPSPYLDSSFAVAYLQSAQLFCSDGYNWTDDYSESRAVIKHAFEQIKIHCKIGAPNITLAGFSGGAMASMSAVTHQVVTPKQVLAFMPHFGEYVGSRACRDVPITVFKAEFDVNIDDLFSALKPLSQVKKIILHDASHALPADMASYVLPYLNKSDKMHNAKA